IGHLINTVTVGAANDTDTGNNTASDDDSLTPRADLQVTKVDHKGGSSTTSSAGTVVPGAGLVYTVTVSNSGPSNAVGATVADTFPANYGSPIWTATGSSGTSFSATGSGNIADTVTIPAGGSVTYTVSGTVSSAATGTLSNTATTADPSGTTDPTPANNSATDSDSLTPQADLYVTKTAPTSVLINDNLDYTITVKNNGPSNNAGFTLTDAV